MIQSVKKAMAILSIISDGRGEPVKIKSISEKTGFPPPTASHILESLSSEGYVVRVSHTDGYILGPSLFHLTRFGRYDERLVALARPVLRSIEKKSGATVILSIIQSGYKFIIDYLDGEQNIFPERQRIITDDIYRTATGRVILSRMGMEERREIYGKYGVPSPSHWRGVDSFHSLSERLDRLACEDVVISGLDGGIAVHDILGFASPIYKNAVCIGALGIAQRCTIGERVSEEAVRMLSELVLRGARAITKKCSL